MNSQPRNVLWLGPTVLATAALALNLGPARAFDFGPPDGFCGNPPDGYACNVCHYDYDLNSGDGSLQLIGLPATAVAGTTYTLTVRLSDPQQKRWGFELTAVDEEKLKAELPQVEEHLARFGDRLPAPVRDHLELLKSKLS